MAKLGWVLFGLLTIAILGIGAKSVADDSNSARLDEIKTLLTESLRIQKTDVHRRLFPNHKAGKTCDFDERCASIDSFAKAHARAYAHPWTEDCGSGKCQGKEETYKKNLAEREPR